MNSSSEQYHELVDMNTTDVNALHVTTNVNASNTHIDTFQDSRNLICNNETDSEVMNELVDESSYTTDNKSTNSTRNEEQNVAQTDCILNFDNLPKSSRKHGIYFAHLNIRTLLPNMDQVKVLLIGNDIDAFALNETRLCDSVDDIQVYVDKFAIYRKDRNRQGGGVLVYVNEKRFHHTMRSDLMSKIFQLVAVEINQPKSVLIIVLAWYRPPGSSIQLFEYIEQTLSKLDNENKDIILLGSSS